MLSGCSIFSYVINGRSITVTIDTARLNTDISAVLMAVRIALKVPVVQTLLGPNLRIATTLLAQAMALQAAIAMTTGPSVSGDVDATSVQSLVKSLMDDLNQVIGLIRGTITNVNLVNETAGGHVQTLVNAILSLLPLIELIVGLVLSSKEETVYSEQEAIKVIHETAAEVRT